MADRVAEGRAPKVMALLRRYERPLIIAASLFGTFPLSVLASVCVARFLPLSTEARLAFGLTSVVPLWVSTMCAVFLARSAVRAWSLCLVGSVLLGAIAYGLPG